eukprot:455429-Rhodomonas_salina.1
MSGAFGNTQGPGTAPRADSGNCTLLLILVLKNVQVRTFAPEKNVPGTQGYMFVPSQRCEGANIATAAAVLPRVVLVVPVPPPRLSAADRITFLFCQTERTPTATGRRDEEKPEEYGLQIQCNH